MKTLLPLCPFGNVHSYVLMRKGEVIFECFEHYRKQTLRNRFEILGANGRQGLSIPVEGQKGEKIPIGEIKVVDGKWRKLHLTSLKSAYKSSPFYDYYIDDIVALFEMPPHNLADFNVSSMACITSLLSWDFNIEKSTSYLGNIENVSSELDAFKPGISNFRNSAYPQVFQNKHNFQGNLSILDVLFNLGPETLEYLDQQITLL